MAGVSVAAAAAGCITQNVLTVVGSGRMQMTSFGAEVAVRSGKRCLSDQAAGAHTFSGNFQF